MSQTHVRPDRESPPSTPRWVKVFGVIVIVLILLFVILHLTGHGLGGHTLPGGVGHSLSGDPTPSVEHDTQQP